MTSYVNEGGTPSGTGHWRTNCNPGSLMSSWPGRAFPSKRQRVERLGKFWEGITSQPFDLIGGELGSPMAREGTSHAVTSIK